MIVLQSFVADQGVYSYVVAPDNGGAGLIVDPGDFDKSLLEQTEKLGVIISAALVTHPERYMLHTLRTLHKVYPIEVYAGTTHFMEVNCTEITAPEPLEIGDLQVHPIPVAAHSSQSLAYRIEDLLFTGSIVHAGTLGETPNAYAEELLIAGLKDLLMDVGENTIVLPSVGPPTTVRAELHLSPYYRNVTDEDHAEAYGSE